MLAINEHEAVSAAQQYQSVAMKIASRDILHKTEVGGVRLDIGSADAAGSFWAILDSVARHAPGVDVEGVLVSPMRGPGVELIVGVVADPDWGPMLAVGFGGALVEVLQDASLRRLPVAPQDIRQMLDELRGRAMLGGVRGGPAVDIDAAVAAIHAVAVLAEALGADLLALEVNPLRLDADGAEALDAVLTWRPDRDPAEGGTP
jgi:hypothetical protein